MKKKSVLHSQSVKRQRKRDFLPSLRLFSSVGSGLLRLLVLLAVAGVISLCFLSLYHYLLTSPYIRLEQVDVKGVDGGVKDEIVQLCGLDSDLSLMFLNLDELKQKMEKHPWVRSVKLERRFPHTLIVEAEKETPLALVLLDKIYYMNRWGKAFKEVCQSDKMDLPVITGLLKQGSDLQGKLDMAACFVRALEAEEGPWSLDELSEIHVQQDGGISFYFDHLAAEIKLMCEDLGSKMDGLRKVTQHLSRTGRIHQVNRIDLNYVDGAVVSFRKGCQPI